MYGVVITGGILFFIFGLITLFGRLRQMVGESITSMGLIFLLGQLLFVGLVCLIAGVVNSLITWVVEERLYRKYSRSDN